MQRFLVIHLLAILLTLHTSAQEPVRELRGVWIATVNNIDWPSTNYLDPAAQRGEYVAILDKLQQLGINALFVQVRTAADALYDSPFEPWSQYLNGRQGKAPEPYYDPLEFMIQEAHRRGMEFHAWINPFRAVVNTESSLIDNNHITKREPSWFIKYGTTKIFNPGIPEARYYILRVIADLVMRYDIDGLHFDDYFYPYPIRGELIADATSYYTYGKKAKDRASWRRQNIDRFVRDTYLMLQQVKPYLKFGVSPFPVWRNRQDTPEGSPTTGGLSNYSHLYADVRKWLEEGWIDYIAPQCYQVIGHEKIPFKKITSWWSQNTFGRHLYVGHAPYRLLTDSDPRWSNRKEILNQVQYTRSLPGCQGNIYYNATSLLANTGGVYNQIDNLYRSFALPPTMPWKAGQAPAAVLRFSVSSNPKGLHISWKTDLDNAVHRFIICRKELKTGRSGYTIIPGTVREFTDLTGHASKDYAYYIATSDRLWNLSEWVPASQDQAIRGY